MSDPDIPDRSDAEVDGGETAEADDAFSALGNATRLRVLRTLAAAEEPPTFTDLFEASEEETTAGFAYHLRQLADRYVHKDPETERYHLTYAGRQAARALDAGTYTDRVTREPESIDGECPVCGESALEARVADNVVRVECTDCPTELLSLPFPPGGVRERDAEDALAAFDSYHRSRFRLIADGVCPDCAGRAGARIEFVEVPDLPGDERRPVLDGACANCDFRARAPVSLSVAEHPEVVAFFRAHGESVRDRPLWNLGPEWGETVLSVDPPAVTVSVRLGGEELRVLVGEGPTVVDVERVGDSTEDEMSGEDASDRQNEGAEDSTDAPRSERDDYDATVAGSS